MADRDHVISNPLAQTANAQRLLPDGTPGIISFGPYTLLATLRRLAQAERPVPLGDREFDLLCTLTARAGEIVSNRELMERIGAASAVGTGELRFHINALREALSQDRMKNQYIRKVAGRGYIFTASICRGTPGAAKAAAHFGKVTSSMQPSRRCERARRALRASIPGGCWEPPRPNLVANQPRGNVFQLPA
jgi:DNA-binding winged helix-turn-helix (wHTH) protein